MLQYTLTSLPMQTEPQTWTGLPSHQWKQDLFFSLAPLLENPTQWEYLVETVGRSFSPPHCQSPIPFKKDAAAWTDSPVKSTARRRRDFQGFFFVTCENRFVKARHASITVERRPVHKKAFKAALVASLFFSFDMEFSVSRCEHRTSYFNKKKY